MKKQYKDIGIVIRRQNFLESDRIITFITKKNGKLQAVAKGSRKPLSKFGGHLELFNIVDLVVYKGKNLDVITGANTRKRAQIDPNDKKMLKSLYKLMEIFYYALELEDKNEAIYNLLIQFLDCLDKDSEVLSLILEYKIYCLLGHAPELSNCSICLEKINEECFFDFSKGGFICRKCGKESIVATDNLIKLMRVARNKDLLFCSRIKVDSKLKNQLEGCVRQMRFTIIEKDLKVEKMAI